MKLNKKMYKELKKAFSWFALNEASVEYGSEAAALYAEFGEWLDSIEKKFDYNISVAQFNWLLRKATYTEMIAGRI